MPERVFPPPWTAEVTPNCFIVRDANGQALSYIYYESEPGRRSAAKLLSKDEARSPRGSCDNQELLIHINVYALQKSHSSNCV